MSNSKLKSSKNQKEEMVQHIFAFFFCYTLLILLSPLFIFRLVVKILAKIFYKNLGEMVHTRSVFFAGEWPAMYETATRCGICTTTIVEGVVTVEKLREEFLSKVVHLKNNDNGLVNPELMQKISSWMGYLFWEWEENFSVNNHIKYYDGPSSGGGGGPSAKNINFDKDMPEIMKDLVQRPFVKGQSPWEFWVWNDVQFEGSKSSKTVVIFRVHHALSDGISILKLTLEDLMGYKLTQIIPQPTQQPLEEKKGAFFKFWTFLRLIAKAPHDVLKLGGLKSDPCVWTLKADEASGKLNAAVTSLIPLECVKSIKKVYGGPLNTVMIAGYAGGLRNFMLEKGLKIPNKFFCTTALPMPGHPMRLRNHMAGVTFPLPLEIPVGSDRLKALVETFKELQTSTEPFTFFYMAAITCALPHWMVKKFFAFSAGACLMSNFPGPTHPIKSFDEMKVQDLRFGSGFVCNNVGLGAGSISYDGGIRLTVGIDEVIFTDPNDVKDLVRKIEEEIYALRGDDVMNKSVVGVLTSPSSQAG